MREREKEREREPWGTSGWHPFLRHAGWALSPQLSRNPPPPRHWGLAHPRPGLQGSGRGVKGLEVHPAGRSPPPGARQPASRPPRSKKRKWAKIRLCMCSRLLLPSTSRNLWSRCRCRCPGHDHTTDCIVEQRPSSMTGPTNWRVTHGCTSVFPNRDETTHNLSRLSSLIAYGVSHPWATCKSITLSGTRATQEHGECSANIGDVHGVAQ